MQDFLMDPVKLQCIDFFLKIFAVSDCTELEKSMAIEWVAELNNELMARLRNHKYSRLLYQLE